MSADVMTELIYAVELLREIAEDVIDHDERQNRDTLAMEKTCPDCLLCKIDAFLKREPYDFNACGAEQFGRVCERPLDHKGSHSATVWWPPMAHETERTR